MSQQPARPHATLRAPAAPVRRWPAWRSRLALAALAGLLMLALLWWWRPIFLIPGTRPLVMEGGDPHLRALMRTISASESNVMRPYHVLHGGEQVGTLERHPNRCEAIGNGPNRGNCSTAAGRYQLLFSTWLELAARYHPDRTDNALDAAHLSFSPLHQDLVVYAWLNDSKSWGGSLSGQLRQGRTQAVLQRLSRTWTSLGYGIENNSMSRELPGIYKQLLSLELADARSRDSAAPSPPTPPK
jgi:muramidase (phage lysozyme)